MATLVHPMQDLNFVPSNGTFRQAYRAWERTLTLHFIYLRTRQTDEMNYFGKTNKAIWLGMVCCHQSLIFAALVPRKYGDPDP